MRREAGVEDHAHVDDGQGVGFVVRHDCAVIIEILGIASIN